jgi:hypothetical protein
MENITKYSDYKLNESMVEIEDSEEGVYVLTLHDIHNIVNEFTDEEVNEESRLGKERKESNHYAFMKEFKIITNYGNLKFDTLDEMCEFLKTQTNPRYFPISVQIIDDDPKNYTKFGPSIACQIYFKPLTEHNFNDLRYWHSG